MIGKLTGKVDAVGESHLILDVNGVGYEVQASARTLRALKAGDTTSLTIDTKVGDDFIRLFGFSSEVERSWFRTLQGVQGVGPKAALSVLGVLSTSDLGTAIALGNWQSIEQAQGVGKKLAQRIASELKDKAPALSAAGMHVPVHGVPGSPQPVSAEGLAAAEAISALSNLGYQPLQASGAVAVAVKELGPDADVAKLIRRGLKELAR